MLMVQCIGGFTQTEDEWNGVMQIKERLLSELDEYSALSVRVSFKPWNAEWGRIAKRMHLLRNRYSRERFVVVVCAYSWGAGNGLKKLADQLARYDIEIEVVVMSDGVYHSWWLPKSLWFLEVRALFGLAIRLPTNVKAVHGFAQTESRPRGVKPTGNGKILSWTEVVRPHAEMDDLPEWHDKCASVALVAAKLAVGTPQSVPANAPPSLALESRLAPPKEAGPE